MENKKVYVIQDYNTGSISVFDSKEKLKSFIMKMKIRFWEFDELEFVKGEDYETYSCIINEEYE